jgi:hypothetical protein
VKTKVRVKRSELLKVVDGRLGKAERTHERAVAAYPDALAAWERAAVERFVKVAADAERGKLPTDRYGNVSVTIKDKPSQPSKNGHELCNLRRLQKTLQMGAEDSILLSQEDADAYFGPCVL